MKSSTKTFFIFLIAIIIMILFCMSVGFVSAYYFPEAHVYHCYDFINQKQAQMIFNRFGTSSKQVSDLDKNHNSNACESLSTLNNK